MCPLSAERVVQSRHLLRAIIRECTYLPDNHVRQWVRQHVLARFRAYTIKAWERRDDRRFDARLTLVHRKARQALSQLQRANEGEREMLLKVLLLAYGRTGRRRRELILPLLPKAGQNEALKLMQDGDEQEERSSEDEDVPPSGNRALPPYDSPNAKKMVQSGAPHRDTKRPSSLQELTPQLQALVKAQVRDAPPPLTRPHLRHLSPKIPELNSWLRLMPLVRVNNMAKTWYATLLKRVLPPVPDAEWHRLRQLALGEAKPEPMKPRRVHASVAEGSGAAKQDSALEMVVKRGQISQRLFGNREAHQITPRFMRRLYAQVFSQCPRMDWDNGTSTWSVVWGGHALHSASEP